MEVITGIQIGKEIEEALGLENLNLVRVSIHIDADSAVLIKAEMFGTNDQMDKLLPILKEYELVEKK